MSVQLGLLKHEWSLLWTQDLQRTTRVFLVREKKEVWEFVTHIIVMWLDMQKPAIDYNVQNTYEKF